MNVQEHGATQPTATPQPPQHRHRPPRRRRNFDKIAQTASAVSHATLQDSSGDIQGPSVDNRPQKRWTRRTLAKGSCEGTSSGTAAAVAAAAGATVGTSTQNPLSSPCPNSKALQEPDGKPDPTERKRKIRRGGRRHNRRERALALYLQQDPKNIPEATFTAAVGAAVYISAAGAAASAAVLAEAQAACTTYDDIQDITDLFASDHEREIAQVIKATYEYFAENDVRLDEPWSYFYQDPPWGGVIPNVGQSGDDAGHFD